MRISDWSSDVCSSDLSSDLRIVIPPTRTVAVPKRSLLRPGPATLPVHCTGDHLQCTLARGRREDIVVGARVLTGAGWPATALQEASQARRSEEHTSELQSLMRTSYAVFCLKKKTT